MPQKITLFFLCIFSFHSSALKEADISFVYNLLDKKDFYHIGEFVGEEGLTLRYARFGKKKGREGSLVFVSGRAENLLKYIELFYDLHLKGWSPIYTYDHRGQGFSDRLPDYPDTGHVESYSHYRKDLKAFLNIVKEDPKVNQDNLFVMSHSMGGMILVDYLQTYENPGFKALALSAPMLQIQVNASSAFGYLSSLYRSLFSRAKKERTEKPKVSIFTNSKIREDFFRYVQKDKFPQADLGPPSLSWALKSLAKSHKLMRKQAVQKIKIPVLILQAEQEALVSNKHHKKFCEMIPQNCELRAFQGKHELFVEKDEIRDQVITEVLRFFARQKE